MNNSPTSKSASVTSEKRKSLEGPEKPRRSPSSNRVMDPSVSEVLDEVVVLATEGPTPSYTVLKRNLWFFIWLKAIGSYDSGCFSAVLGSAGGIAEAWSLSSIHQGTLTSSVFLGNVIGCPVAGHLFSQYDEKNTLTIALVVHLIFSFFFGAVQDFSVALVNRFFIGFSLAFIVVYTPVWIDEFAPKRRQSVWMALQNAGVPVGIMVGYLIGAFFSSYTSIEWSFAFYFKAALMIPTVIYLIKADRQTINTIHNPQQPEGEEAAAGTATSTTVGSDGRVHRHRHLLISARARFFAFLGTMKSLSSNTVYMCSTIAMCFLYFSATALQNFVTPYLRAEPFNASMQTIMMGFGLAVVTAPVLGVVTGGLLLDRIGGYSSDIIYTTLFALGCGAVGATFALVCVFMRTTGSFLIVVSILLFCGGAIIPPGIGLTMSSLRTNRRPAGAAFSQTIYNLLGNFSGPLVCGAVAQKTGNLRWGIITILCSSLLINIPLAVLLAIALKCPGYLNMSKFHAVKRRRSSTAVVIVEPQEGSGGDEEEEDAEEEREEVGVQRREPLELDDDELLHTVSVLSDVGYRNEAAGEGPPPVGPHRELSSSGELISPYSMREGTLVWSENNSTICQHDFGLDVVQMLKDPKELR